MDPVFRQKTIIKKYMAMTAKSIKIIVTIPVQFILKMSGKGVSNVTPQPDP